MFENIYIFCFIVDLAELEHEVIQSGRESAPERAEQHHGRHSLTHPAAPHPPLVRGPPAPLGQIAFLPAGRPGPGQCSGLQNMEESLRLGHVKKRQCVL